MSSTRMLPAPVFMRLWDTFKNQQNYTGGNIECVAVDHADDTIDSWVDYNTDGDNLLDFDELQMAVNNDSLADELVELFDGSFDGSYGWCGTYTTDGETFDAREMVDAYNDLTGSEVPYLNNMLSYVIYNSASSIIYSFVYSLRELLESVSDEIVEYDEL